MYFQDYSRVICSEIDGVLSRVDGTDIQFLIQSIVAAKRVFLVGAGRMGLMLQAFGARLRHLGLESHLTGTVICPPITSDDLLLVASSSGETASTRVIVEQADRLGCGIITITANPGSTMGRLAKHCVCMDAPATIAVQNGSASRQPMKTLFEQALFILLESVVLQLMDVTGQTAADLAKRHANLE
jgi:6-phospho-3-hexuloisomerase